MLLVSIPDPIAPAFVQRVNLDGQEFQLEFTWNMRSGWYMSVSDAASVRITSPRKLVVLWDLLSGVVDDRKPPGLLTLIDRSEAYEDPSYEDLGQRCILVYIPVADVDAGLVR